MNRFARIPKEKKKRDRLKCILLAIVIQRKYLNMPCLVFGGLTDRQGLNFFFSFLGGRGVMVASEIRAISWSSANEYLSNFLILIMKGTGFSLNHDRVHCRMSALKQSDQWR